MRSARPVHAAAVVLAAAAALSPAAARGQCGPLAPITGYDVTACTGGAVGQTCAVSCAAGYAGTATSPVCQANGTWTAVTGCSIVTCPALPAPTGYALTCDGTTYGSSCAVACDGASGYVGTASATSLTCGGSGSWSPSAASLSGCTLATCPAPGWSIAYAYACSGTSFGDSCAVTCGTGFVGLPVIAVITCGLGTWSDTTNDGCTRIDCGTPSIPGADVSACAAQSRYLDGPCTPSCLAGYSGSPGATCTADGTWSITGGCSAIPCWPSPGTNGDSCGTGGEACLSGTCAVPAAGQLCAEPSTLSPGVQGTFPLDAQHDLLAATRCPAALAAGKDVFVDFAAIAGRRYRLEATAEGAAGLDALVVDSCASTACATLDAEATATTLAATLEPASAGTVLVAVHVRGAPAGASARVTVSLVPEPPEPPAPPPPPPPAPSGGSSSGCATAPASAVGPWAALALALAPAARRRRGAPIAPTRPT